MRRDSNDRQNPKPEKNTDWGNVALFGGGSIPAAVVLTFFGQPWFISLAVAMYAGDSASRAGKGQSPRFMGGMFAVLKGAAEGALKGVSDGLQQATASNRTRTNQPQNTQAHLPNAEPSKNSGVPGATP